VGPSVYEQKDDTLGTISLIMGVIGILIAWWPFIGLVPPIIAIVTGYVSMKDGGSNGKYGMILGFVALVIQLLILLGLAMLASILG
jgi:hypothetical protein